MLSLIFSTISLIMSCISLGCSLRWRKADLTMNPAVIAQAICGKAQEAQEQSYN